MHYEIIGYSTVGMYAEHTDDIRTACALAEEFKNWANMVEIYDVKNDYLTYRWESEE